MRALAIVVLLAIPSTALAQKLPPGTSATNYTPATASDRVSYIVLGTVGPQSLGVGVLAASWNTAFNTPEEWGQSWEGWGKRYLQREADVTISNSIEAGLGAIWGEDPRYIPSGRKGIWPRARYSMKTVFLGQYRDGHLGVAYGRIASNVFNNLIENTWLPPSATTWQATTTRALEGFLGRLGGNLWAEFWPDAKRRFFHKK